MLGRLVVRIPVHVTGVEHLQAVDIEHIDLQAQRGHVLAERMRRDDQPILRPDPLDRFDGAQALGDLFMEEEPQYLTVAGAYFLSRL